VTYRGASDISVPYFYSYIRDSSLVKNMDFVRCRSEDLDNRARVVPGRFYYVDTFVDYYLRIAYIIRRCNCWKNGDIYAKWLRSHCTASSDSVLENMISSELLNNL